MTPHPTVLVSRPAPEAPPERSRDMGIRASMTAGLVIVGVFVGGGGPAGERRHRAGHQDLTGMDDDDDSHPHTKDSRIRQEDHH